MDQVHRGGDLSGPLQGVQRQDADWAAAGVASPPRITGAVPIPSSHALVASRKKTPGCRTSVSYHPARKLTRLGVTVPTSSPDLRPLNSLYRAQSTSGQTR